MKERSFDLKASRIVTSATLFLNSAGSRTEVDNSNAIFESVTRPAVCR